MAPSLLDREGMGRTHISGSKEIKMRLCMVSAIALCISAAQARANGQVWYSASVACGSGCVGASGPGQTLQLCCFGSASWNITVHYTTLNSGAISWALDHYGNTA